MDGEREEVAMAVEYMEIIIEISYGWSSDWRRESEGNNGSEHGRRSLPLFPFYHGLFFSKKPFPSSLSLSFVY